MVLASQAGTPNIRTFPEQNRGDRRSRGSFDVKISMQVKNVGNRSRGQHDAYNALACAACNSPAILLDLLVSFPSFPLIIMAVSQSWIKVRARITRRAFENCHPSLTSTNLSPPPLRTSATEISIHPFCFYETLYRQPPPFEKNL